MNDFLLLKFYWPLGVHFGEPVQFNKNGFGKTRPTHLINELKSWRTRFC